MDGMARFMTILFWIAVAMLVDSAIDLWGLKLWQRLLPTVNVKKVAFTELAVAVGLLVVYFLWRAGGG